MKHNSEDLKEREKIKDDKLPNCPNCGKDTLHRHSIMGAICNNCKWSFRLRR